jgi:hypothetical protein
MKQQNKEPLQAAFKLAESTRPYSLTEEDRTLIEVIEQHQQKSKRLDGWLNFYYPDDKYMDIFWPTKEDAKDKASDSARQIHIREVIPVKWRRWTVETARDHQNWQETADAHNAEMERVTK